MSEAKPFSISKRLVMAAYQKVRSNRGSAGVDEVSMNEFDQDTEIICTKFGIE